MSSHRQFSRIEAMALRAEGHSFREIGDRLGVSSVAVHKALAEVTGDALGAEAARRGVTPEQLRSRLLAAIAADSLFDAILGPVPGEPGAGDST